MNGFEEVVRVLEGRAEDFIDETADLLVANIHYDVIKTLFEQGKFADSMLFIVSGLMRSQAGEIKDWIARNNLMILKEWDHEMTWYTFLIRMLF